MLFSIDTPADNRRGPAYMEQAIAALHAVTTSWHQPTVVLAYACHDESVGLYVGCQARFIPAIRSTLLGQYPDCRLQRVDSQNVVTSPSGCTVRMLYLTLSPDVFSIREYAQFEDRLERNSADPIAGILAALAPSKTSPLWCRVSLEVRPARASARLRMQTIALRLQRPFFQNHPFFAETYASLARSILFRPLAWLLAVVANASGNVEAYTSVSNASEKSERHLFSVRLRLEVAGPRGQPEKVRRKLDELVGAFARFDVPGRTRFRRSRRARSFLLSDREIATLWHPPFETVRTEKLRLNPWREAEPPLQLHSVNTSGKGSLQDDDVAELGRVKFRDRSERFGIKQDDRRRHLALVGKTGMGKSTLLLNLITADMTAGRGVGLVDPHGDLAEAVLDRVPSHRTNDVVLFDAGDREFPVAFNPLACDDTGQKPLVVSGVVSAFKKLYGDSWGPRLEHILRNALSALVAVPDTSLLSLLRLLSDTAYRQTIVNQVDDPVVRSFWQQEFAGWNDRFRSEAIAPVQNKLGHFLGNPLARAIVGQPKSTIDLRRIMDAGQILIVNLSKGRIGEDTSALLGSLMVTTLQQTAMSRADIPENDRRDFFLYIDEFQNFATDSFSTILSEARKYRLSLTLANQYLSQMDDGTSEAVFGNVGSMVSFQVGPQDAEILVDQLGGDIKPNDLVALPRFTAYIRLLIEGMPSRPFSMQTIAPSQPRRKQAKRSQIVRRTSRHRYARPIAEVEAEIDRAFTLI